MTRSSFLLVVAFVLGLALPASAQLRPPFLLATAGGGAGATCTDGVDCYCDTISDASLINCEDAEAAAYYAFTGHHWVRDHDTYGVGSRGQGSLWQDLYNQPGANYWTPGQPNGSPRKGATCTNNGQGNACGLKEYCSAAQGAVVDGGGADCWEANSGAAIDIERENDFKAEIGSLTLSGGKGLTADIGGPGKQHIAFRIGVGDTAGIVGGVDFSATTEVGYSSLVAYSSNLSSTGILSDYWKGHEWGTLDYIEWWTNGNMLNVGTAATFPFRNFFWQKSGSGTSACNAALDAALLVGDGSCDGGKIYFGAVNGAGVGQYDQATDWPFGTWGCVRGHMTGLGTSDLEVRIWFNEELVIHIDGFDGSTYLQNQDYRIFRWNHYANKNIAPSTTTATAFVYEDNAHLRKGAPVSCAAIGFP